MVFSGGMDSVCACALLRPRHELHGITFSYGQRASTEVARARRLARKVGLAGHRVADIGFMRGLYGGTNVLTGRRGALPGSFDYSVVVPVRNAVFLSIAAAWAYSLGAPTVAYGAHTGDSVYPDCRPAFARRLESALRWGEIDGVRSGARRGIEVWSPYREGLSKADLFRAGLRRLGPVVFETWSCYRAGRLHCGRCESCNNRKAAIAEAGAEDLTGYAA